MELFKSRPRVVYTNAVGDKVYPVVVDIKKGIKSTEDIQFVSSDVNTGILSVAFIQGNDNYNVTGADVVCSVMRPDASTLELPCEVVGENIVEVPLGINGTSQDGVYSFDFKVFKGGNKVVGTPIMNYSVSLSIGNGMAVEEDDRLPVLTMLMTQLTELKGEARESINQANTATVASREATANAIEATANANAVSERVSQETSEAISRVDTKVTEIETRFNALTTSQQQDAEVIDARDGETSLKARLDRDLYKDGMSLSDRVSAIEGLKDSQNMKYETDKGYLVCKETKNGVIDDLKIEGNTLVNIHPKATPTLAASDSTNPKYNVTKKEGYIKVTGSDLEATQYRYVNMGRINFEIFKPNTTYTVVFTKFRGISRITIQNGDSQNTIINGYANAQDNKLVYTFVTKEELVKSAQILYLMVDSKSTTLDIEVENPMIFEGDLTANPPSGYIEGLKSVGGDVDEIEVLSRKEEGNLFDENTVVEDVSKVKVLYNKDGVLKLQGVSGWYAKVLFDKIPVNPNTPYWVVGEGQVISGNGQCTCAITDGYKTTLHSEFSMSNRSAKKISTNTGYLSLTFRCNNESNNALVEYKDIMIIKDKGYTLDDVINMSYVPPQSDKKQILFYNENGELEPIQELHEWDSIEKHSDNKWYYHKRSGKVVLNGSEFWQEGLSSQFTDTHMYFACNSFDSIMKDSSLISDKFENKPTWDILSRECIDSVTSMNKLRIRLAKSKLTTQDVAGFKQWLQENNVTVVYQLAQEEVYELAPLHLDSYANETLILCNSGAISPKMEFSITSHINNLVLSNTKRINALEEKVFSALKQVLAGDMYSLAELLYPEDFVEENPENEIMLLPFE